VLGSWLLNLQQTLPSFRYHHFKDLSLATIRLIPRLNRQPACLHALAIVSILAYVFIYVNLPMFLFPGVGHDDGLYISHARDIVSGHWLGPYSQFTLMKGPGYSLFLALISLFGIPVALAHSVLYGLSVWLLSYATNRILNSVFFSLIVLEVLLWHFGPHSMRVVRDTIVTPQILIVFSLLVLALFVLRGAGSVALASLAGSVFSWFWITREDGLIALPAIAVLFACAFHKAYSGQRSVKFPLKVLAGFVSLCIATLAVVCIINLRVYNTFTSVDIKGNFESAFEALESVKPDIYSPYAAVSRSSRDKISKISPTFAQLHQLIDGPPGSSPIEKWKKPSCDFNTAVCGDYANGWFIWALRDAVALHGDYSSAHAATAFYMKVQSEVKSACSSGVIACYHNPLPFIPHVNKSQMLRIGPSLRSAFDVLSLKNPSPLNNVSSIGTEEQVLDAAKFLGVRNHTPPPPVSDSAINRRVVDFAVNGRNSLIRIYSKFLPGLLLFGFFAAMIGVAGCLYRRNYSVGFAVACVAWLAAMCRVLQLVLGDISSFAVIIPLYIGYAYPFACYASLMSIFLVARWIYYSRWD
jgi:hypothetical protein